MSELELGPGHLKPSNLPAGWAASRLESIASFRQGGTLGLTKSGNYVSSGAVAFSAAGPDGFVDKVEFKDQAGVVLSAIGANCGRCFYAYGEWTTLANVQAILPGDQIDPKFLFYRLNQENYWERSGSAQPFIKPSSVKKAWVAFPYEKSAQAKISEVIGILDTQIEATEALIAKQERLRAGLMQDLFTRGLDENGELRPPLEEAPHLYHETELGWLPKGWQVRSLSEELRHSILGTAVRGNAGAANSVPLIKMGNLRWGELELSEFELLDRKFADREPRHWLENGDLLFNTRNTPDLVGKSAVYHAEFSAAVFDNNILRMRFSEFVEPDLLCAYMNHGLGKQQVNALATGTTSVAAVYWSALKRYRFPHPSSQEEGKTLVEILLHSKKQIDGLRNHLGKLHRQKTGLMQDLLTGKVSVEPLLEKEPA